MNAYVKKAVTWLTRSNFLNHWFTAAMEKPDIVTRMVFLGHNTLTGCCIVYLVVNFVHAADRSGYVDMVLALGGTHAASTFLSKKKVAAAAADSAEETEPEQSQVPAPESSSAQPS